MRARGRGPTSVLFDRTLIATEALLTTKFYIPRAHPNLVPRPRPSERLAEGMNRKLTLHSLRAPQAISPTQQPSPRSLVSLGLQFLSEPVPFLLPSLLFGS